MASIPSCYGEDRLVLMVKNPRWLHAYWEITPETRQKEQGQLVLRTYGFSPEPYFFDIEIADEIGNWYIDVNRPDTDFYCVIGIFREGEFKPLIQSNRVHTPRNTVSGIVDENWLSLEEIYRQAAFQTRGPASPEFIEELDFERRLAEASPAMVIREDG